MKTASSNAPAASRNTPAHKHLAARFIPSEEIESDRVQHWQFGELGHGNFVPLAPLQDGKAVSLQPLAGWMGTAASQAEEDIAHDEEPEPQAPGISEEEVQHLLEQARQDAFAQGQQHGLEQGLQQGHQQGREAADSEWQQRMDDYQRNQGQDIAQRLHAALVQAQQGIKGLQQQMAPELLQLACDIARQVVRQELRCNPQALLPVVREALDMLGAETKPATVRLNPDDWAHLETHLRAAMPNPKVEWLADGSVPQGGCRVEGNNGGALIDGSLERRWQRAVAALGLVSTWYDSPQTGGANAR